MTEITKDYLFLLRWQVGNEVVNPYGRFRLIMVQLGYFSIWVFMNLADPAWLRGFLWFV